LPKEVREALKLEEKGKVVFYLAENGEVIIQKA